DGIRAESAEQKLAMVAEALARCPERLLISQDAGWYNVGQPRGGQIAPLDWLPRSFVPMLRAAGITQEQLDRLLVANPATALVIRRPGE
ncbi:MAG: hypothetical protein N2512_06360, partial [Armatimonadetes bacterium]|nr:hypothetical protein [Armatimonadota bacterium]